MTNPATSNKLLTLQNFSIILHANQITLEKIRGTVEDALASAIQAEVAVRRMGLREANQQVDNNPDALADASRLQLESNEAFQQIREQFAEICACIEILKARIITLDSEIQSVRMDRDSP
jgi:hypothetical protein